MSIVEWARIGGAVLERRLEKARGNPNDFIEFVMQDDDGTPVVQAPLHRVMHLHVDHCWRHGVYPALLVPFGHGKSFQLSVGRVAYELGKDVTLRTKIVCQGDDNAMKRAMGVMALLRSDSYKAVFPHVRPVTKQESRKGAIKRETMHALYLARPGLAIDPSVEACGVMTAGTGGRADLLVFDDVCDQENSLNKPELRPKVIANFENVWMQRLVPSGRALYVGTPWHEADLTHDLLRRPGWSVLRIWVSDDFRRLECEVHNPPPNYPIPPLHGNSVATRKLNGEARA